LFGPYAPSDGIMVGKVLQHIPADPSKLAQDRAAILDDIKQQRARDRNTLFEAGIRDTLTKEKKIKVHQDVINRLVADYINNKG